MTEIGVFKNFTQWLWISVLLFAVLLTCLYFKLILLGIHYLEYMQLFITYNRTLYVQLFPWFINGGLVPEPPKNTKICAYSYPLVSPAEPMQTRSWPFIYVSFISCGYCIVHLNLVEKKSTCCSKVNCIRNMYLTYLYIMEIVVKTRYLLYL